MRRCDIVYGQDAAEDRVVVYLDARLVLERLAQLVVVLGPGDVQRMVALAARAHQLGAHSLGYIVFEAKRRYPRRDYKRDGNKGRERFNLHVSIASSACDEGGRIILITSGRVCE